MEFILGLEPDTFIDLLHKAIEKETDEMLWDKWLHQGQEMSFEEFKNKHKPQISKKSDDEILDDAANILKSMSRK